MKYDLIPYIELVKDVSGGNLKVKAGDYALNGKIPIVDQGKEIIGGYTDNEEAKFKGELPVIIFGDIVVR